MRVNPSTTLYSSLHSENIIMLNKIQHDEVLELNLARPPVNALNPELVEELCEAIPHAVNDGYRAIVLSGREGLFSAGLDVPQLLQLDRAEMTRFWESFFKLLECVACSKIPIAAAITGHSPAGGAVVCLFADYRVMADGEYKIGLNEVQVGLAVPEVLQKALGRLVGQHTAERMVVAGTLISPSEAFSIGLVDKLVQPDAVVDEALSWCRSHLALSPIAMRETRRIARKPVAGFFADADRLGLDDFIEHWFHDTTQAVLNELVASLKSR
jgi:3,2-trans-enoyl-CoA isomerase